MAFGRRHFLGAAAVGAGVAALQTHAGEARDYRACVIGHTGRGNYGHGLDTAFQKIPGVSVVALADPDEKGREAAARRAGAARTYADWHAMFHEEKPNLVAIGPRWVERRLEMITAAAVIGAHVYMEKPLAASLEEADAIVDVAARHKIKIALSRI